MISEYNSHSSGTVLHPSRSSSAPVQVISIPPRNFRDRRLGARLHSFSEPKFDPSSANLDSLSSCGVPNSYSFRIRPQRRRHKQMSAGTSLGVLGRLSEPFARATGLTLLPAHAPTIIYSAGAFLGIQLVSRFVSPLLSSHYRRLPPKSRSAWDIRVVSMVNCAVLLPLVVKCFRVNGALAHDKAFATHPDALRLSAVATGLVS